MPTRQQFQKPEELFLSSVWWRRLKETTSDAQVVDLAREFLTIWTPERLDGVPPQARPERVLTTDDLQDLAFELRQANLSFSGEELDGLLLEKMSAFFSEAAVHLSTLAQRANPEAPSFRQGVRT